MCDSLPTEIVNHIIVIPLYKTFFNFPRKFCTSSISIVTDQKIRHKLPSMPDVRGLDAEIERDAHSSLITNNAIAALNPCIKQGD